MPTQQILRNQHAPDVIHNTKQMWRAQTYLKSKPTCPIPDVCIDERRLPLFIARATLRDLIAGLEARATCGAAQ